jgi:hypothetical protein
MANIAEGIPMTADSIFIFRTWPLSRPMTSVAFMSLVEEGPAGLNDPVADHLPSFRDLCVYRAAPAPGGGGGGVQGRGGGLTVRAASGRGAAHGERGRRTATGLRRSAGVRPARIARPRVPGGAPAAGRTATVPPGASPPP